MEIFELHSAIIKVLESKYFDQFSYPSASLDLLGLNIMLLSPKGLKTARDCMMCVHSIVSNVWFDGREPVSSTFGRFAFIMLDLYGQDIFIRTRAFSVIRILNIPDVLSDVSGFVKDMLACRHVSAGHQLNILSILQSITISNETVRDRSVVEKVDELYEAIRQYIIFSLVSHPDNPRIQETCCALLMEIRVVEVVVDKSLVSCLLGSFERFPKLVFVAMALAYFLHKIPSSMTEPGYAIAVVGILETHPDDDAVTLLASMALSNCVSGCAGGEMCCKVMEVCDHLLTKHTECNIIQRYIITLVSCAWDWGCPHPYAQFGAKMPDLVHRVCAARSKFSDELSLHLGAARICAQSLLGHTSVPTFFKLSYVESIANSILEFQKYDMILVIACRFLSAYYSLIDAVPLHGLLRRCLHTTIQNHPDDMTIIMAYVCLLGGLLKLCSKEDAEPYSSVIELSMEIFRAQAKSSSGFVVMMSRVLSRWSELCSTHASQYLKFTLTLPGLLREPSQFTPVISTIRCMLNSITVSPALANDVVTALGSLMVPGRSPMILISALDTLFIVFRKSPKYHKKFVRSKMFRVCLDIAKREGENDTLRRMCAALVSSSHSKYPLLSM